MNFNDGTTQRDLDKSTTAVDASQESGEVNEAEKTGREQLDQTAMEAAERAQNRIHSDEQETPGSTLFTK